MDIRPGMAWTGIGEPRALARVLFVHPGITCPGWGSMKPGGSNEATYGFHGFMHLSACLKSRGHSVKMIDLRTLRGWPDFARALVAERYDLAVIGHLSIDRFAAACAVRVLKTAHPSRPVVVGGVDVSVSGLREFPPTDLPSAWLPQAAHPLIVDFLRRSGETGYDPARWPRADCVVHGEGEAVVCLLAEAASAGENLPAFVDAGIQPDLTVLPAEDRFLFDEPAEAATPLLPWLPKPFMTVSVGRGCPYRCTYCSVGAQASSMRPRLGSVPALIDSMQAFADRNGGKVGSLMIHDDILMYPKWIDELCEAIIKKFGYVPWWCQVRADFIVRYKSLFAKCARAGMVWASVGVESGSDRMLKIIDKRTTAAENLEACRYLQDELGINVFCNWMLGLPGEQPEDVKLTADLVTAIRPAWHSASIYCDYPGTPMSHQITRDGLRLPTHYTTSHYPWQWAIKGVDYSLALETRSRVCSAQPNAPRRPKYWRD